MSTKKRKLNKTELISLESLIKTFGEDITLKELNELAKDKVPIEKCQFIIGGIFNAWGFELQGDRTYEQGTLLELLCKYDNDIEIIPLSEKTKIWVEKEIDNEDDNEEDDEDIVYVLPLYEYMDISEFCDRLFNGTSGMRDKLFRDSIDTDPIECTTRPVERNEVESYLNSLYVKNF